MKRTRAATLAAAVLAAACATEPGPRSSGTVTQASRTTLLAGREQVAPEGHNALACVTLPLAARALAALPGAPPLAELLVPADAEAVGAEPDLAKTLPAGASFVHASTWTSSTDAAIVAGFTNAFGSAVPGPSLLPGPPPPVGGWVGYAALLRDLRFATPFPRHEVPLRFRGSARELESFGLTANPRFEGTSPALRAQVRVLFNRYAPPGGTGGEEYGVALAPEGAADRIVLAVVDDLATPGAAWRRAKELAGTTGVAGVEAPPATYLQLPVVDFDLGDKRTGPAETRIEQRVRLRLDRRGAKLRAEAVVTALGEAPAPERVRPPVFAFDRPFLLALVRDGESEPYFLAVLRNDELFAVFGE
jgi:hypothetical protein